MSKTRFALRILGMYVLMMFAMLFFLAGVIGVVEIVAGVTGAEVRPC